MRAEVPSAAGGLGVFGGTFNPIHVGHLRAAEEVVEALGLDRLYFVPSARPPHKVEEDGDVIATHIRGFLAKHVGDGAGRAATK